MLYLCLVIQKDAASGRTNTKALEAFGLKPYTVTSIGAALHLISQWRFDLVALDACGFDGVLETMLLTLQKSNLPIVVVNGGAEDDEQIRLMERGATEVLPASLSVKSVGTRLRRLAELRSERPALVSPIVRLGPLALDTQQVAASVNSRPLELTGRQFELLLLLVTKAGGFVHRQTIARTLRCRGGTGGRSIDMLVVRIRQKLRSTGEAGLAVHTIYGQGYSLTYDEHPEVANESKLAWCA